MKLPLLLFALTTISLPIFSQSADYQIGKFKQWDVDLKSVDYDPEASAVVLFDLGKTEFLNDNQGGYDIQFTRIRRIKILSEAGLKYAEIEIPIYVDGYGKTERLENFEGYTYNFPSPGNVDKAVLNKNSLYKEQITEQWHVMKSAFPGVKVGSIIEYKSVVVTPFLFNIPNWEFQDEIPTLYSEYICKMIPFYEYVFYAQGITRFDIKESYVSNVDRRYVTGTGSIDFNDMVYRYALKNVAAFKDESYITSVNDYLIMLKFQLAKLHRPDGTKQEIISTWPKLKEEYLKNVNFGKFIKSCDKKTKKIIESEFNLAGKSQSEIASEVINYTKENISWDGRNSKFAIRSINEVLKERTGNSAEINLFTISMLNQAGLPTDPVVLSTRNHGKLKVDYPFSSFFNYVIGYTTIDGNKIFLDATDKNLPYNRIPIRCINDTGLIIDRLDEVTSVDFNSNILSESRISIAMRLSEDLNSASTKSNIRLSEFEAYQKRNRYNNDSTKLKNYYLTKGFSKISKLTTYKFENRDEAYSINIEGIAELEQIDSLILLKPFLKFPMQELLLTQENRTYPVDLIYPQIEVITSLIEIPTNCQLVEYPDPIKIDSKLASINTKYDTINENTIKATATFHLKKAIYQPSEYKRIKFYFKTAVRELNKEIVLKRKN